MGSRPEVLVSCCHEEDVTVLRSASGPGGPVFRTVESAVKAAHQAVAHRPMAVVLGVDTGSSASLDVIPVIHAVHGDLPVIVVASEDSLELERSARQKGVFYYLVHPIDRSEVKAVLENVARRSGS